MELAHAEPGPGHSRQARAEEPIFSLAWDCDNLLQECLHRAEKVGENHTKALLEDYERRFVAWWEYLGVFAERKANLDRRLRHQPEIQDIVVRLLLVLRRNLAQLNDCLSEGVQSQQSHHAVAKPVITEDNIENDGFSSLKEVSLEAIDESIEELSHVGIAIRHSSRRTETERARRFVIDHPKLISFEAWSILVVETLYPNAPESLVIQLGQSIVDRYARLLFRAPRHDVLKKDTRRRTRDATPSPLQDQQEGGDLQPNSDINERLVTRTGVQHHEPPTIALTSVDLNNFQDKLKSTPTGRSRSGTTVVLAGTREPPIPQFDDSGNAQCEWCFSKITQNFVKDSHWNKIGREHYHKDLEPFSCLLEECNERVQIFSTIKDWREHMLQHDTSWTQHIHTQQMWRCVWDYRQENKHEANEKYLHESEALFSTPHHLRGHVRALHKETWSSLGDTSIGAFEGHVVDAFRTPNACPLCLFTPEGMETMDTCSDEASHVPRAMENHIAKHLQNLMVLSLRLIGIQGEQPDSDGKDGSMTPDESRSGYLADHSEAGSSLDDLPPPTFESPKIRPIWDIGDITETNAPEWTIVAHEIQRQHIDEEGGADAILDHIKKIRQELHLEEPGRGLNPIRELWNQAYEELKEQEGVLMRTYESVISEDLTTTSGSSLSVSDSKLKRQQQMEILLAQSLKKAKETWKLKFRDQNAVSQDLTKLVISLISWADEYVSKAQSVSPYASIAWVGVCLILQIAIDPTQPTDTLNEGLQYVGDLIAQGSIREALYERRYQSTGTEYEQIRLERSHKTYRDSLKSLYIEILKFEVKFVCYFTNRVSISTIANDNEWNDWDPTRKVQNHNQAFFRIYERWEDYIAEEEYKAHFERQQEQMRSMTDISGDVLELRKGIEAAHRDTRRSELLNWLSDVDPSYDFHSALQKHEPHTGNWLLESPNFKHWKTSPSSLLWLSGKAGSGKTILSACVIKSLRDLHEPNPHVVVAYYYFSFTHSKKQDVEGMLSSIIKQLYLCRYDAPPFLRLLQQYQEKGQQPDRNTLEYILAAAMHGFSDVFLVLDAIDECPTQDNARGRLLIALAQMHKKDKANLHLLITSRKEAGIEVRLGALSSSSPAIEIKLDAINIDSDIGLYIDQEFAQSPRFAKFPSELITKVKSDLIRNADGMFRYVSCQLDVLQQCRSENEVWKALVELPKGLDDAYEKILHDINPADKKGVASVLKWLAFSVRPLCLREIAEIFILDPDSLVVFDEDDRLFKPEDVLKYLPGLIVKVPRNDSRTEIKFSHWSIKEYLCSKGVLGEWFSAQREASHLHIAACCLTYHSKLSFRMLVTKENISNDPLWSYAARYGAAHLGMVTRELWTPSIDNHISLIFKAGSQHLLNMIRIWDPDEGNENWYMTTEMLALPLYYAASMGAFMVCIRLIGAGAAINDDNGKGKYGTPLQAAAHYGDYSTVQVLLNGGADVNARGGRNGTALQVAIASDSLDAAELLLSRGAIVDMTDSECAELFTQLESFGGQGVQVKRLRRWRENPDKYIELRRHKLKIEGGDSKSDKDSHIAIDGRDEREGQMMQSMMKELRREREVSERQY